ncbi:hypothetical protein PYW08_008676 [Mythimna loreyi]|uniref:Uncharacterized protein n=1 Tax=Mythimna loreyi TaxID=667449 RepID=A0ACC2Q9C6_9NEOP|nr:hypothetical protein PYW08_008676 [Mythimna loreyi]
MAEVESSECDQLDQLLLEDDGITMPLPDFVSDPHLLISKVRKHYMEYVIKLLSNNYETHQKLVNKNIYLPSAIWTCAKKIEMSAAQACMVAQIYRKNIIPAINELKRDTKKGKLNRRLYECLNKPPQNSKKTQTSNTFKDSNCQCGHNKRKRHTVPESPKQIERQLSNFSDNLANNHIPPNLHYNYNPPYPLSTCDTTTATLPPMQMQSEVQTMAPPNKSSPMTAKRISVESQDSDELMLQLEKLFQGEANDDDLFEGTLYDKMDSLPDEQLKKNNDNLNSNMNNSKQDSVIENHSAQIKLLDERIASLAGLLVTNDNVPQKTEIPKNRKSRWLCEEYFLKQKLYELLDQIGDTDRKKLEKIKEKFIQLFDYDSDDEGILSPLDETPEFISSCKERIAPWVVKLLTPYYIKGHIKGKVIFKALAKHLIRLIYQCSRYPREYEVTSFVSDFLKNHRTIRCEADFKEFKIENI